MIICLDILTNQLLLKYLKMQPRNRLHFDITGNVFERICDIIQLNLQVKGKGGK